MNAMEGTYQRGPDGRTIPASDYPPIPDESEFFTGYGYEKPLALHYWCWRSDYSAWGACVTFANGWRGVTNPMPPSLRKYRDETAGGAVS